MMLEPPLILALVWRPVAEPLLIFAGAAAAAGLACAAYGSTMRARPVASALLLLMRLAMVAGIAALLMGPSEIVPPPLAPARPRLVVLLDTSRSMQTSDCAGLPRVTAAASAWLTTENIQRLSAAFNVELLALDATLRPLSATQQANSKFADGKATHLAELVEQALGRLSRSDAAAGAALLVLSDGRDTDGLPLEPAGDIAKAGGIRVHAAGFGGASEQRNIAITAAPAAETILAGETTQLIVRVLQTGYDGAAVSVKVTGPGGDQAVPLTLTGAMTTLTLPIKPEDAGNHDYAVSVTSLEGESRTDDNAQSLFIEATGKRIRVLMLEGEPGWDTRFLAQALRRDERIDLTAISQLASGKREAIVTRSDTKAVAPPTSGAELAAYDIVILGKDAPLLLSGEAMAALPEFVAQGGHLVLARGRPYDEGDNTAAARLAVVEPVTWDSGAEREVQLSLTDAGRANELFAAVGPDGSGEKTLAQLPKAPAVQHVSGMKTAAHALLQAAPQAPGMPPRPAIVSMEYGRGSVLAVLAEGLWRWSLLPPQMGELSGVYDAFWSNTMRRLALGGEFQPGEQVSLRVSPRSAAVDDAVTIDIAARWSPSPDFRPRVSVTDPKGKSKPVALVSPKPGDRRWSASYTPEGAGIYRVAVEAGPLKPAKLERRFSAGEMDIERLQTSADTDALRRMAERSGGVYFEASGKDNIARLLQQNAAYRPPPETTRWAWDNGGVLAAMLLWVGGEWLARRRAGWM